MRRTIESPSSGVIICCLLAAFVLNELCPLAESLIGTAATQAQPEATLNGLITDPFGGQFPDATIRLYSVDRVLQVKSDEKGRFRFAGVPPGTYQLEATRPGFKTKKIAAISVTNKNAPLSIILDVAATDGCVWEDSISYVEAVDGRTLTGIVLNELPVAGARIDLASASGTWVASGQSNFRGGFRFANAKPGQYVLRVSHPGYQDETTESFWIARETTTKVVTRIIKRGLIRLCGGD